MLVYDQKAAALLNLPLHYGNNLLLLRKVKVVVNLKIYRQMNATTPKPEVPSSRAKLLTASITQTLKKLAISCRRSWFRLGFFFKHEIRIKEFIVIEPRVLCGIFLLVLSGFIILSPRPWSIAMPSLTGELYVTENILRTVSIFIGIVFSFILLSFNVFYKYFGRFTFITFFRSKEIRFIFTFFISTLILLVYTTTYLKESTMRDSYGDFLYLVSVVISACLVLSVIPVLILLLRSSQNRNNIKILVASFNKEWTESEFLNRVFHGEGKGSRTSDRDPINLLIEVGTAAIKDFDRQSIFAIKKECISHFEKIHRQEHDFVYVSPFEFYGRIGDMGRALFPVAIKERNEIAAMVMINMLFEAEVFYIRNFKDFNIHELDEHIYDGIFFGVAMKEMFVKALQFNEDGVAEHIIEKCRSWLEVVINDYLPGIKYDYPSGQRFHTDKPSFLVTGIYQSMQKLFRNVLSYKKYQLYKQISHLFSVTDLTIVGSGNTRSTKVFLLQQNGLYNIEEFETFIKFIDSEISFENYPFGIASSRELDEVKSLVPLQYELKALDILFTQNKLNVYVINSIKAIALHSISILRDDNKTGKSALQLILKKIAQIKSYVSAGGSDKQKEVYILLYKYLEMIKYFSDEKNLTDKDIVEVIQNLLSGFEMKENFERELNVKGYFVLDHLGN
ncbi:LTA synthase family protein [Pedobacter paludis]|uniref:DUF2254 domain-containing protein n=1 Tax=Pedobacter paludis TaxID=2203212 RepID=A0A317F0G6_9SPHI|nr:hypothetical protein [Pedobacter paludis]PWS32255.1 hypothetical protein DF947_10835 [Pedobacter paludis]